MDWNGLWRLLFFHSLDCFSRGKVNSNRKQLFKEGETLASCYEPDFLAAWASSVLKLGVLAWVSRTTSADTVCVGQGLTEMRVYINNRFQVGVHRVPGGESSHSHIASAPTDRSTNCCPEHSQLSLGLFKKSPGFPEFLCERGSLASSSRTAKQPFYSLAYPLPPILVLSLIHLHSVPISASAR